MSRALNPLSLAPDQGWGTLVGTLIPDLEDHPMTLMTDPFAELAQASRAPVRPARSASKRSTALDGLAPEDLAELLEFAEDKLRWASGGVVPELDEPFRPPCGAGDRFDYISTTGVTMAPAGTRLWNLQPGQEAIFVRWELLRAAVAAQRKADPVTARARDIAAARKLAATWEFCAANDRRRLTDPTHPAHKWSQSKQARADVKRSLAENERRRDFQLQRVARLQALPEPVVPTPLQDLEVAA